MMVVSEFCFATLRAAIFGSINPKNLPKRNITSTGLRIAGASQSGICAVITAYRKPTSICFKKSAGGGSIIAQPTTS
jgi:hypothetical protein